MLIAGVDEAGRGPIIGPMVMATIVMREEDLDKLKLLGVKDSKLLTREKREQLYEDIMDVATDCKLRIVSNIEIDKAVKGEVSNLNLLELLKTAEMLNEAEMEKAIIDCPSPNLRAYQSLLKSKLEKKIRLIATHKADQHYLVVAAASIVAKVTRDRLIDGLKKEYDVDFGSGYLSDTKTMLFLEQHWHEYPFFRTSWRTWKQLKRRKNQTNLSRFVDNKKGRS